MQRLAEPDWVASNLDLFVLCVILAGGGATQSVAPYRTPALPNLGIYRVLEIIFQRYNNASNFGGSMAKYKSRIKYRMEAPLDISSCKREPTQHYSTLSRNNPPIYPRLGR